MKNITQLLLLLTLAINASAQCNDYIVSGSQVFHANHIRTVINTGGDMFWDLRNGKFQVPFDGPEAPSAIFAAGVWIGAFDADWNLKLAAQTYRSATKLESQEYLPGPLLPGGVQFSNNCSDWDRIWTVNRFEIEAHISDYLDNGKIDDPQKSIFEWPGIGNAFFEEYNGFSLPDIPHGVYRHGYAPFLDIDKDGIYEPHDGEFPIPQGLNEGSMPDQITWHVFNDAREHYNTQGERMNIEVQQTCYAFYCDSEVLNTTLFMDFILVNMGDHMDSMYFGIWMDPDLGCYEDDFIGSVPELDAFIVYNEDEVDGNAENNCFQGVPTYTTGPPVLSVSFLGAEMSKFIHYVNGGVGNYPSGMQDPQQPIDYYQALAGRWRDGSPLCLGGTGYNPDPDCIPVDFIFSGDPSDTSSWAMSNLDLLPADRRCVASSYVGPLKTGQTKNISMSYALHLDPDRNHLGNVGTMYEELPVIREHFSNAFVECNRTMLCADDCVWAGDANSDGIANYLDILDLGLANTHSGPVRQAPLTWAPYHADAWAEVVTGGVNMKHSDMNGDGRVHLHSDIGILETHYGNTHDNYKDTTIFTPGDEIIVDGGFERYNATSFHTITRISLNPDLVDSLYGIAFTMIYDTQYFRNVTADDFSPFSTESTSWVVVKPGRVDYAAVRLSGDNEIIVQEVQMMQLHFLINYDGLNPGVHDTTELHIANIRAILNDGTQVPIGAQFARYIFLDDAVSGTTIQNMSEIHIYPNPSTGVIHVAVPEAYFGSLCEIRTVSGALVFSGAVTGNMEMRLTSGIYVLFIRSDSIHFIQKLVIMD